MATSSSDLKSSNNKKRRQARSVVSRLAKAAKESAAKSALKKKFLARNPSLRKLTEDEKKTANEEEEDESHLASITNLSRAIDEELLHPRDGYRPPRETSSMRSLLEHNDRTQNVKELQTKTSYHIAIVFSKPLWQDQITIEYASRLVSLARAMKYEAYRPAVICFCGSTSPVTNNLVAETCAGVIFFRHLCKANQINLDETDLCMIDHDNSNLSWSSECLVPLVEELYDNKYIQSWLEKSEVFESETDEYGLTRRQPRKKIHIHWTLISTNYHLCNLNDIHIRSPRQSPLNTIQHELDQSVRSYRGIVKTTWCFRYSAYPYVYSKDELTAFLGKCYLIAQSLRPLLINVRGVAGQEFFQRDNYRDLISTRRSLVTLLEEMNEAYRENKQRKTESGIVPPNLKARLQKRSLNNPRILGRRNEGYISTDVALESALLSLGRCMDIVRPAGTLAAKSVSREEWCRAQKQLEHFLQLMQKACDPDRPLPPSEWGSLSIENVTAETTEIIQLADKQERTSQPKSA